MISEAPEFHNVIRITTRRSRSIIIIDAQAQHALLVPAYLFRSPKNSNILLEAKSRSETENISFEDALKELNL